MELFLGGYQFNLKFSDKIPSDLKKSAFTNIEKPIVFKNSKVDVEIIQKSIPKKEMANWNKGGFTVDTRSTWALALENKNRRPFHMAPSPSAEYDINSLHLFADNKFKDLKIYYGKWKNKYPERWLFYPYEQALFIHLLQFSGSAALCHSSAVEIDGKGYMFLGDSGAGKSTISEMCENEIGFGKVFSDDRVIVRYNNGKWWMFGTPWNGSFPRTRPEGIELGGMFFLEKTAKHQLTLLKPGEAFIKLLPVVFGTWWLPQKLDQHTKFIQQIAKQVQFPLYRLGFCLDKPILPFLRKNAF